MDDLISNTTVISLGFTAVLLVVSWLFTEALSRSVSLKRPTVDYWILLWLTWDVLIHFILVRSFDDILENLDQRTDPESSGKKSVFSATLCWNPCVFFFFFQKKAEKRLVPVNSMNQNEQAFTKKKGCKFSVWLSVQR